MARYKEIERCHPVGGNVERYRYYEKWWRFLKTLNRKLHCDAAIPPLAISPEKLKAESQRDICIPVFIAIFSIIAKMW